jgi:hypothetical protein
MRKFVLLLIVLFPVIAFAQKGHYVGLSASNGSTGIWFDDSFNEIGIDFENRFTDLSGVGVGMSLVRLNNDYYYATMDYVRMPIYYKLHTKLINVSPIFMMDFLRQRTFAPAVSFSDYSAYYPNFFVGFGLAVSKDFSLTDKLFLETKAQASIAPNVYELFTIGLALKYKVK